MQSIRRQGVQKYDTINGVKRGKGSQANRLEHALIYVSRYELYAAGAAAQCACNTVKFDVLLLDVNIGPC